MNHGYFFSTQSEYIAGASDHLAPLYLYRNIRIKDYPDVQSPMHYPITLSLNQGHIRFYFFGLGERKNTDFSLQDSEKILQELVLKEYEIWSIPFRKGSFSAKDLGNNGKTKFLGTDGTLYDIQTTDYGYPPQQNASSLTCGDILLHFIFDFHHTDLFCNHPEYSIIKQYLEDDLFFKALIAKYEYQYWMNKKNNPQTLSGENEQKFLAEKTNKAAHDWLQIIRDPKFTEIIIEDDNEWFKDVETEYLLVINSQALNENDQQKEVGDGIQWFLQRYALWEGIVLQTKFFLFTTTKKKAITLGWFLIFSFVFPFLYLLFIKSLWPFNELNIAFDSLSPATYTLGACCVVFPFFYSFYLDIKNRIKTLRTLILMISVLLLGVIVQLYSSNWVFTFSLSTSTLWFFIGSLYALIGVILMIFVERLFLFLSVLWTTLFRAQKKEQTQLNMPLNTDAWSRVSDVLLSATKILKFFQWRILLSSLVIWILLASLGMFSDLNFSYNWYNIVLIIILSVTVVFFLLGKLSVYITSKDRSQKVGRLIFRSIVICFFGLIYSFSLGLYFTDEAAKKTFEGSDYLDDFFGKRQSGQSFKARLPKTTFEKLDSMYSAGSKSIISNQVINNQDLIIKKLDEITGYVQNKKGRTKFLNSEILPHLKQVNQKYFVCYKSSIELNDDMKIEWYLLPDILVFYSFISVIFGLLFELVAREKITG